MLRNDERGFYFVIFLVILVLLLVPLMGVVVGVGQMMIARSEAQTITDAIALDIANQSSKTYQQFTYSNSCGDVEYIGREPYLQYVGDSAARDIGMRRFMLNMDHVLQNIEITSVSIEDPYIPAENTAQEIPASIKQGSHDPIVTVTTKSSYSMIFSGLWGKNNYVTRSGSSRKSYKGAAVNLDRYEAHPAHPPCPRPVYSGGGGGSVDGGDSGGDSGGEDVPVGG
jgi:hypothetical protein